MLIVYHFSTHLQRNLRTGDLGIIGHADPTHVVVTCSRNLPRTTCPVTEATNNNHVALLFVQIGVAYRTNWRCLVYKLALLFVQIGVAYPTNWRCLFYKLVLLFVQIGIAYCTNWRNLLYKLTLLIILFKPIGQCIFLTMLCDAA